MKKLFNLQKLLVAIALMVVYYSALGQQSQSGQAEGVPHADALVWLLWALVLGLLLIIGFMLKAWLSALETWKQEIMKLGAENRERIVTLEARCDIRHTPEELPPHHKHIAED